MTPREHSIAVKIDKAVSNTIAIKVKEKEKNLSDPIERLVKRLSSTHGLWINGIYPTFNLPPTAKTKQVVAEVFRMTNFNQGRVIHYKVVQTREVQISVGMPLERYTAALVQTNLGEMIVLIQYQGKTSEWWCRVYNVGRDY